MSKFPDHIIKHDKYKWEFLRRNPKYIREWEKLQDALEKWHRGASSKRPQPDETGFCRKWGISNPLEPTRSYEEQTDLSRNLNAEGTSSEPPNLGHVLYAWMHTQLLPYEKLLGGDLDSIRVVDGLVLDGPIWDEETHLRVPPRLIEEGNITIKIDLRYSKNRLMKEFEDLLDEWINRYKSEYEESLFEKFREKKGILDSPNEDKLRQEFEKTYKPELKKRERKFKKKYHVENFDTYLQVYDLRENKVSWNEIKNTLNLNSIQTGRNHYNAACELIKKGVDAYVK